LTASVRALEVPPPGEGVATVICAVPILARSVAGMAARSSWPFTKTVGRAAPFQRITDVAMKSVPFTVRMNADVPACAAVGDSEVSAGSGFVVPDPLTSRERPPASVVKVTIPVATAAAVGLKRTVTS
jgi:hypothetical protein